MTISQRRSFTQDEIDDIIKTYQEGNPASVLSAKYDYHIAGITRILKENNIPIRGSRIFTDDQERDIARRYVNGESARGIARSFGIDKTAIISALQRQGIIQRSAPERNRLYHADFNVFDKIDNEEAAYWLGFIWADGNVNRDKTLTIALKGADREHLEKFKCFLGADNPISNRIINLNKKQYPVASISITDRHFASRLMSLGVVVGRPFSDVLRKEVPYDLENHFMRGLFDGDGSLSFINHKFNTPVLSICGNSSLISYLWDILDRHDIHVGKKTDKPHRTANIHYLRKSGGNCVPPILDFMYRDATVYLQRKYDRYKSVVKSTSRQRNEKGRYI